MFDFICFYIISLFHAGYFHSIGIDSSSVFYIPCLLFCSFIAVRGIESYN